MKTVTLALLASLGWCTAASNAPTPSVAVQPPALAATPAQDRGEALVATVPLYRHGSTTLEALRGRVVVVEMFSPDEAGWPEAHHRWRTLTAEHVGELAVVTVAVASDDAALTEHWDLDPPNYVVSWDPQGALALRLGIAELPTVMVLDREGRLAAQGADREALGHLAEQLLSP